MKQETKTIEQLIPHYENFLVKFVDDKKYYYMKIDKIRGVKIRGNIVKKITRVWFI